jgi:CRISPR/Cas system-associated exonuclease Cas4 (RecB family)
MDSSPAPKIANKTLLPTSYSLPPGFQFSQSSLQDFAACELRFELRYLRRLAWPAVESEPIREVERLARLGTDFHRLVQQHLVGIAEDVLTDSLTGGDADLQTWWQSYLRYRPVELAGAVVYPEVILSMPLRGYRLLARFDLLAALPDGSYLIVDWKTSLRQPSHDDLARRMQTRVYPYVLAMAGSAFNGGRPIDPARIFMSYWYPTAPDRPERFAYNLQLQQRDELFLSELIEQIKHAAQSHRFSPVEDKKPCVYCVYRSFCDRGEKGGPLVGLDDDPQELLDVLSLNWDQIAEIQF